MIWYKVLENWVSSFSHCDLDLDWTPSKKKPWPWV